MFAYPPQFYLFLAVVIGLIVGSFLNVVIYRLPKILEMQYERDWAEHTQTEPPEHTRQVYNLAVPRSACPKCGKQIAAYDNIPVVSWLLLRGRCRHCGNPISVRYPIVEAVSAFTSAAAVVHFGPSLAALAAMVYAWVLIALFLIDADTQFLPDDLTLPLLWLGLLVNVKGMFTSLDHAVIGAVAGYLVLWSVYWIFKLVRNKEGMGYGDFKLLAAIGAWLGWQSLPIVILLSSVVGAIIGSVLLVISKRGFDTKLPFGPYLAAAGLLALYFQQPLYQLIWGIRG